MVGAKRKRFQEKDLHPEKLFLTAAGVNADGLFRKLPQLMATDIRRVIASSGTGGLSQEIFKNQNLVTDWI